MSDIRVKTADYYAERLKRMIECKTISVKGSYDDTEFAVLRGVMRELFPLVHKNADFKVFSDDCWMYRLHGSDYGDKSWDTGKNIMLMSHHDVVAADDEKWNAAAFGGEIIDGRIFGRGTVDTKTPLFAEFSAIEEILEEGIDLPCNVYIVSSHNEEIGGDGVPEALKYFRDEGISFEVILDEGGAVIEPPLADMKCEKCAMVAVHEKGRYYLLCEAKDAADHASLAAVSGKSAIDRMTAFMEEINNGNVFIRRLNREVCAMFRYLAPHCSFPVNFVLSHLGITGGIIKKVLPKLNPQAAGLLGTTCSFTEISGSTGSEKYCKSKAFLRPVDSADFKKDMDNFIEIAKKYDIDVTVDEGSEYHEPADMSRPPFAYMMKCLGECFPQYPAAPFILPAGTDARTFTDICDCVLRFAPIRLSSQQLASVHGDDENIDIEVIAEAVAFYRHFVQNYH